MLDVCRHGQVYEGVCSLALKGKREERGEWGGGVKGGVLRFEYDKEEQLYRGIIAVKIPLVLKGR